MKLSVITLGLIASGLRMFADAVDNMIEEESSNTHSQTNLAGKADKNKQADKVKPQEPDLDEDEEEEEVESAADKKKRLRKEKRLMKKKAEKSDDDEDEDEEEEESPADKKKRLRKEAEAAEEAEEAEESFEDDEEEEEDEEDKGPTKADVKTALVALAKVKGNPAAKAILTKFKVANVSQIDEDDYADVLKAITKASK